MKVEDTDTRIHVISFTISRDESQEPLYNHFVWDILLNSQKRYKEKYLDILIIN